MCIIVEYIAFHDLLGIYININMCRYREIKEFCFGANIFQILREMSGNEYSCRKNIWTFTLKELK